MARTRSALPATLAAGLALLLASSNLSATTEALNDRPYATLRDGYGTADPNRAAEAYAADASFSELYPGTPPLLRMGRPEIAEGFANLFSSIKIDKSNGGADLNFRFVKRSKSGDVGYYRLRVGRSPKVATFYGSFATRIADGRFVVDTSGPASRDDFESAQGPVLFAADDEELDPAYYDAFVGLYGTSDCPLVVTRSVRRLFVLDECTGKWRGLTRESGRVWTAGTRIIEPSPIARYSFKADQVLQQSQAGLPGITLPRIPAYQTKPIRFGEGGRLAGTIYLPSGAATGSIPAVVMIHGSGPQDRNGYASLIGLLSQRLVRRGIAVLAFDKRGVGESDGDWNSAGFRELAADAAQAMAVLRAMPGIDPGRVGLAGSSQAGWIAAEAVRAKADPAFVMLIGAAGSALTVPEQNLYNTRVRMQCSGLPAADISLALRQQEAFFAARRDPAMTPQLAALTVKARARPGLADWLFPDTPGSGPTREWYDVLDIGFDPLPVWKGYSGKAFFLFGGSDDSTPSTVAINRLKGVKAAKVTFVPGMHHIGLRARTVCDSDIAGLDELHPSFLATIDKWALAVRSGT